MVDQIILTHNITVFLKMLVQMVLSFFFLLAYDVNATVKINIQLLQDTGG